MTYKIKEKRLPKTKRECYQKGWEAGCIEVTKLLDEHPEEWDGPCMCSLCMSYADPE